MKFTAEQIASLLGGEIVGDKNVVVNTLCKIEEGFENGIVYALAEEMGADKKTATAALDAVTSIITREVAAGGSVTLPGVGKIYCRERLERMVRNPATGEQFQKPSDKVVKMTIAKALKDSVNG